MCEHNPVCVYAGGRAGGRAEGRAGGYSCDCACACVCVYSGVCVCMHVCARAREFVRACARAVTGACPLELRRFACACVCVSALSRALSFLYDFVRLSLCERNVRVGKFAFACALVVFALFVRARTSGGNAPREDAEAKANEIHILNGAVRLCRRTSRRRVRPRLSSMKAEVSAWSWFGGPCQSSAAGLPPTHVPAGGAASSRAPHREEASEKQGRGTTAMPRRDRPPAARA